MHKYHINFVWSLSQHRNSQQNQGEAVVTAVSAQDAAYILTINQASGKMLFFTIVYIELIP